MKGFEETVPNKSGQEFILVRRRKVPNTEVREAIENYQLRSLWSVEDQLVKNVDLSLLEVHERTN